MCFITYPSWFCSSDWIEIKGNLLYSRKLPFALSEWGDSNARPLRPERSALPTALHSDCLRSGATSNRKSVYIALFLNKLYLYYDVSPLNKVFTTLHRSTQVCVLGSISACKGRYLFGIINISKNFFLYLLLRVCLNFVQHSFRSCFEDFSLYH